MEGKKSHVLDTSIFIEQLKFSPPTFLSKLNSGCGPNRNTLYFCLIEFRRGLLHSWVEYFQNVEALQDISSAVALASESFKIRELKNHVLLESILFKLNGQIQSGDIDLYLAQLEHAIFEVQEMTARLAKKIIGNFKDHPLLAAPLSSREDYGHFLELCKEQYVVNLDLFLSTHTEELQLLMAYLSSTTFKGKDAARASVVSALIEQALNDPKKCSMKRANLKYGDIIIALDTPAQNTIVSKDTLFKLLSEGLGKSHCIIDFK
jgi:hypothetical protein